MLRYLGGVFGIAVLVAVFAQTGNVRSPQAFSVGFASAIGAAAALSLVAAIAGLWVPSRGAKAPASAEACGGPRETRSGPAMSRC